MTRDSNDKRRPERTLVSFAASLLLHAIAAFFLFSLATSSSEETAPESSVNGVLVTVTREAPKLPVQVQQQPVQPPVPHASVIPSAQPQARPQSAPPHPRVLHELSKFAPTAPPNPTPAPESTLQPAPAVTEQPQIAVSAAPMVAAVPTSVPLPVTAVSIKTPPTASPVPKPSAAPSIVPVKHTPQPTAKATPTAAPPTAQPEPSPLQASAAPVIAMAKPIVVVTPGSQTPQIKVQQSPQHGSAPTPGPKSSGSPGPKPAAAVKGPQVARPIQAAPATPRPAPAVAFKHGETLNQRLQNLIPTSKPSTSPAPQLHYHFSGSLIPTPPPPPTPPPDVLANTKYLYEENVASQRWKQSFLGTAPEEDAVEMYVTSVKRIGPIKWCTGWVARLPMPGSRSQYMVDSDRDLEPKWIIEPNSSFICGGHLEPFTPPTSEPSKGS